MTDLTTYTGPCRVIDMESGPVTLFWNELAGRYLGTPDEAELITVKNDDDRVFVVRIVREGDRYGLNDCLTHDDPRPMIEFYDATYIGDKFGPRGQFTGGRYFVETLDERYDSAVDLALDGGIPVWSLTAQNVRDALDYAHNLHHGRLVTTWAPTGSR